jgi:hypothetical protein
MILRLTHDVTSGDGDIMLILVAVPEAMSCYPVASFEMISEDWLHQRRGSHASARPS